MRLPAERSKYGNKRAESRDGHVFPSKRERDRYEELKLLERAGEITDLRLQPKFGLRGLKGGLVGMYVADFEYREHGVKVIEDVKSRPTRTAVYRLKAKLMKDNYGVEIREVE